MSNTTDPLVPLILMKEDTGYKRIPCEIASNAQSRRGPAGVSIHSITRSTQPDIVVAWLIGETMCSHFIFRYENGRYVKAKRDISNITEPYSPPSETSFETHLTYKKLQFIDYDGDGTVEVIQRLGFAFPNEWTLLADKRLQARARVWKWDATNSKLQCIEDVEVPYNSSEG